ncbi:hypothetical protein RF11_16320 [Thelohanellus kitauei]|uniref:Uncharacterized protein n=1 Tax=Thelohanellus kitauei TaxID=669202 RepID=A0A0C2JB14_THEKT|nr:hypothetical protein RF11_16320 [Thelohanellus kitauei]
MLVLLISIGFVLQCSGLVKKCHDTATKGTLVRVHIDGCKKDKCTFHSHGHMTGIVRFIPHRESKNLQASMSAQVGPFHLNMPGFDTNGCKKSGVKNTFTRFRQSSRLFFGRDV